MNAPLPRSRYGKQYDENYERIFGVKSHAKTEAETIKNASGVVIKDTTKIYQPSE